MMSETSSMRYRSKHEIIGNILSLVASGPKGKTKILYGANLSFNQLKSYMQFLIEQGLVEWKADRYHITSVGTVWLRKYDNVPQLKREAQA